LQGSLRVARRCAASSIARAIASNYCCINEIGSIARSQANSAQKIIRARIAMDHKM
jgi:hypothetical protein